jgi:hypothetical protein
MTSARAEYLEAMGKVPVELVHELMRLGIPKRSIELTVPALINVRLYGDRYRPDPMGAQAFILPVCVGDAARPELIESADPETTISLGHIVDIVAFHPRAPEQWALRCGRATVLGAIPPQYCSPPPVRVHRGVWEWLLSRCDGIVIVTRDPRAAARVLDQIAHIAPGDDELRRRVAA